jgi:hypothetical protein
VCIGRRDVLGHGHCKIFDRPDVLAERQKFAPAFA